MKNRLTIGDNQTVACFICGERGNITYIIIANHVLLKRSDSKVFIKNG